VSAIRAALYAGEGLPSPARRLARDRLGVLVLAVVTALALTAAQTTVVSNVHLTGAVDANWRGAYDILVRPAGAVPPLERTGGLVEPNFLSYAGRGGITLAQLTQIRALPGVELAAPIAVAGYLSYMLSNPTLYTDTLPDHPTVFELTFRLITSDGLHEIVLEREQADVLVDSQYSPDAIKGVGIRLETGRTANGRVHLYGAFTQRLPPIRSPLIAVDPTAEQALLGPGAVSLERFSLIADRAHLTAGSVNPVLIPPEFALSELQYRQGDEYDPQSPVVPVVVNRGLLADLRAELTVVQVGHSIDTIPEGSSGASIEAARQLAGPGLTTVGTTIRDLSAGLRPFEPADYTVLWPGSGPMEGGYWEVAVPQAYDTTLVDRPAYDAASPRPGSQAPTFRVTSLGPVGPDGRPAGEVRLQPGVDPSSVRIGVEAGYRQVVTQQLPVARGFLSRTAYDQPFHFAPIGSFDLATQSLPDNPLNYVPLGAYDPPTTTLVAAPDGAPLPGPRIVHPTLNPAGFIDVPPLAITDLQGATLLRGDAPIDAIRIRVAGLAGFDALARASVERVADEIRALGLDVQIVAGSSPQPVELYVPGYFVDRSPAADLGYVAQDWTTLGAAQRVEVGLGDANTVLLGAALAAALLLAVALEVARVAARTREVVVLRACGWPRGRVRRWLVDEALLAGGLTAAVAVAAWRIADGALIALATGLALAAVLPASALLAAQAALRAGDPGGRQRGDAWAGVPRRGPLRVWGPVSLGLRSALGRPARTSVLVAALAVASSGLALGAVTVAGTAARVGPTRLATALSADLRPAQLALLGLTVAGTLLAAGLLLRGEVADRRRELMSLAAAGWPRSRIARSLAAQRAVTGLAAAAAAAVLAWVAAWPVALQQGVLPAIIAAVLAASVVAWGGLLVRVPGMGLSASLEGDAS
jgi:hypothetical protein